MFDPHKIFEDQYGQQLQTIEESFGQQEEQVRSHFDGLYQNLHQQYQVERKYLDQTPIPYEQKLQKLQQLNKKYEMKILDLRQQAQPHFTDLEQKRQTAFGRLNGQAQEIKQRLTLVDELISNGRLDPAAGMQEQLQTLGVSVPLSELRGPSRLRRLQDIQKEINMVESLLDAYEPKVTGFWVKDQPLRITPTSFKEDLRKATETEAMMFQDLKNQYSELRQELQQALQERNVAPMTRAMNTAKQLKTGDTPMTQMMRNLKPKPRSTTTSDPMGLR